MGNKPSLPANEAIYHASRAGKAAELNALLRNAPPDARPETLLEWQDEDGRTALIVATSKGHFTCVDLLLRYRANVQHVSRRREGGTALHEAVYRQHDRRIVEALLRYGASPFVENVSKFTALDYAIVRRDAWMVRRLERCGYFGQYMQVRVRRNFGLSKAWTTKWVTIIPRYSCPLRPQQPIRRLLFVYNCARSYDPITKLYLDGSSVQQVTGDNGQAQALLMLHHSHVEPKAVAGTKDTNGRWLVSLRGHDRDPSSVSSLIQALNARHEIPLAVAQGGENAVEYATTLNRRGSADPVLQNPTVHQPEEPEPQLRPAASVHVPGVAAARAADVADLPMEEEEEFANASAPPMPPDYDECNAQGSNEVPSTPVFDDLGQDSMELQDDNLCVICLDNPRTCGFVHGASMHRCVCRSCAETLQKNGNMLCPVCRQKVEHVITNFFL